MNGYFQAFQLYIFSLCYKYSSHILLVHTELTLIVSYFTNIHNSVTVIFNSNNTAERCSEYRVGKLGVLGPATIGLRRVTGMLP